MKGLGWQPTVGWSFAIRRLTQNRGRRLSVGNLLEDENRRFEFTDVFDGGTQRDAALARRVAEVQLLSDLEEE